jgi:hypothetical protein
MLVLLVTEGGEARRVRIPDAPGKLSVGRAASCDVRLSDPEADPAHFTIETVAAGLRMSDQGSANGTRVNGHLVSQAIVKPGDRITVGAAVLSIREVKAKPKPAPEARPAPKRAAAPRAVEEAPRPVRPVRRKSRAPMLIVGVVILALGAVAFLFMKESGRLQAAAIAYDEAYAAWEQGRLDEAKSGFERVVLLWPDTEPGAKAKKGLEEFEAKVRFEAEALEARNALLGRWEEMTLTDLESKWKDLEKKYPEAPALDDTAPLESIRAKFAEAGRRRLAASRARADGLLSQGRYWDAVLVWHEYVSFPSNVKPDLAAAEAGVERIQDRARKEYESIAAEAEKLAAGERFTEAKALIASRMAEFRGTRHRFDMRQKLDRLEVLSRVETAEPEAAEAVVVKREEFLRAAEEAESFVGLRRYSKAVALYRETAAKTPFPDLVEEFNARAADLEDYAFLMTELRGQITGRPERFRQIDLGSGVRANAVAADEEHLRITVRGAESKLSWSRMGEDRVLDLLSRLKLEAHGKLKLARFALETGDEIAGHEAITKALAGDPGLEKEAFALLARSRGMEVPDGGFVSYKGRWLTPLERERAILADRIRAAEKKAGSKDIARCDEGLAELRALGEPAKEALVRALGAQRESTVDALTDVPAVRDPGTKAMLFSELQKRRKAALTLIFDTEKYPYPYGPNQKAVQAEVDGLVEKVRIVWDRPIALLLEKDEGIKALYSRAEALSLELVSLGHPPKKSFAELIGRVNESIGIRRYAPGGKEKSALEWNDDVLEYNRVVDIGADDPEKACVLATNLYRMMMGRRAVMMNDKLLKCARAHSKDMKENKFFAHDCPIPGHEDHKKPGQRARIAGYGGGVSENIARGSQDGVKTFGQWYGSSGHHRNLLGARHTEVGVGRDEDFWTQNFGSQKKKVDLPGGRKPGR